MKSNTEIIEISSIFYQLQELLSKQLELEENGEILDMIKDIRSLKLNDFDQIYRKIDFFKEKKYYLYKRIKLMLDVRFLNIGIEDVEYQNVEYFDRALEKLKELKKNYEFNEKWIINSYASILKGKLYLIEDWKMINPWIGIVMKMNSLFEYDVSSEIDCIECICSNIVNKIIQNKKFELTEDIHSVNICDIIQWIDEKIKTDKLRLKHLKNVLIDASLDYIQELNEKEILKGKEDRIYLNPTIQILESIKSVGLEVEVDHEFIQKKFSDLLKFYKNIGSGVKQVKSLINSRQFFQSIRTIECIQIDEDIRRGWKISSVSEKNYFIKFFIERSVDISERFKLESEFYLYLSQIKSFYPQYQGKYIEKSDRYKEYAIIIEHSSKTLLSEIERRKLINQQFTKTQSLNIALALITTVKHLSDLKLINNGVLSNIKQFCHLDIRPENVILTEDNEWKLTNYNLFLQIPDYISKDFLLLLPKEYMAPELKESCKTLEFKYIPEKCDVYSLCKTLIEVESISSEKYSEDFHALLEKGLNAKSSLRPSLSELRSKLVT